MKLKKTYKIMLPLLLLVFSMSSAMSADWLTLGGTEPKYIKKDGKLIENNNTTPKVFGFIQVGYQRNYGDVLIPTKGPKTGKNLTPFSMLPPYLNSQSGFEVNRARIAVRGMVNKENTLNYFLMLEFGEDGVTEPAGHATHNYMTDASLTYTGLPYVNIRFGQFKYPGSEEGFRSLFASEYRNLTNVTSQLLLERFIPNNATEVKPGVYQAAPETSVGAFRDRGIELFHTMNIESNIKVSVAGMVGSGTGLTSSNASNTPTYYAYLSAMYLFGKGKGYYTEALKGYGWYQNGKRRLNDMEYTRERYGIGVDYYHNGLRLGAEYIKARGMIFTGSKDTSSDPYASEWEYQIAADKNNIADGYYFNAQYYVIPAKLEILGRYDYLNRLSNSVTDRRVFKTMTVGVSYHLKGPNRIDFNYAFRDTTAPGNTKAQKVLDNTGNLLSIQVTYKF